MRRIGLALMVLCLSACGESDPAVPTKQPDPKPQLTAPPGLVAAPVTGMCMGDDEATCDAQKKQFEQDWIKAHRGDYQGQRNVAYCLSDGCSGAVQRNAVQACAWRKVILESGHSEIDDGDVSNHALACDKLEGAVLAAAEARAKTIEKEIGASQ